MCCSNEKSVCHGEGGGGEAGCATVADTTNILSMYSDDSCSTAIDGVDPYPVTTGCFLLPGDTAFAMKLECDGQNVLLAGHFGKCHCDDDPNVMYTIGGSADTCMSLSMSGLTGDMSVFMTFTTNPCAGGTSSGAFGQAPLSLVALAVTAGVSMLVAAMLN